jgi:O-antigen ligase
VSAFTSITLFIIYLNVPAVLVREFGLPFFMGALLPLALLIPFGHRILIEKAPIRLPGLLIVALVLVLVHSISALVSIRPHDSLSVVMDWALEGVLLAILIANVIRTKAEMIAAVNAVIGAGCVMGLIVLFQQFSGLTDNNFFGFGQLDAQLMDADGQTQRRLAGPIGETNRFAQIMAVLIPLSVAMATVSRGLTRVLYWGAAIVITAGMALAFSRGAIVALALAAPFAVFFGVLRVRHVAFGALVMVAILTALPHYLDRVLSIGEVALQSLNISPVGLRNADGAARGRLTEMKAAGLVFVDHPILGAGPGMAQIHYPKYAAKVGGKVRAGARRAHNLFLQLAAETGVVGLVVFFVVLGLTFLALERSRRLYVRHEPQLWAIASGLELALIVSLITSLFLHAAYIRYFWVLVGLCAAVAAIERVPLLIRVLHRMFASTAAQVRAQA